MDVYVCLHLGKGGSNRSWNEKQTSGADLEYLLNLNSFRNNHEDYDIGADNKGKLQKFFAIQTEILNLLN